MQTYLAQIAGRVFGTPQLRRSLWLTGLTLIVFTQAFAISKTGPTPANPFASDSNPILYFQSPAEAGPYLAAQYNKTSGSQVTVTYAYTVGPYASPSPCTTSMLCYGIEALYFFPNGSTQISPIGVVQNQGPPGQVCSDGSFVPEGQNCADKSLGLCSCGLGDPIDAGSGNVYEQVLDYETSGQNKLQFIRYYNSRQGYSLASTLGMLWRSNYDRYIQIPSANSVSVERPDGRQLQFTLKAGAWTHDSDVDITLTQSGKSWTLTDHNDTVETYTTTAAGNSAILETIKQRNGFALSLTYNSSNQLASVEDSYGRRLSLTYSNGLVESIETPEATSISYGYSSVANGSNLSTVTYPTSTPSTLTYLYENASLVNALTGVLDENKHRYETWSYDDYSRGLTNQRGSASLNADLITMKYNDATGSRTVTNALGVIDTYTFSTLQGVPKVTKISRAAKNSVAAATETFGYDSNGYLASQTDWNGNKTTFVNDSHGDPTTINEAVGTSVARTTTITYQGHLPVTIATPGITTAFTYDGSGEILTKKLTDTTSTTVPYVTKGQTRTWTNTWANSLLTSTKTPNGGITKYGYNSTGALSSTTDALGHITTITSHTGGGLPKTMVDPNGVTTTMKYDGRQRLTSRTVSGTGGSFTTTWAYDAAGNLTKLTLPDGSFTANSYDSAHRLTLVADALGSTTSYALDRLGDLTKTSISAKGVATASFTRSGTFDALGRLMVESAGAGQSAIRTYDPNGDALSLTDGLKHKATNVYDALNRLSSSTDANSGVTTTTYDARDRILSVKDANSHTTAYVRDGFGGTIQQSSPDSGKTVFHFDGDGNLASKTDALQVVTNQTFDKLDRLLSTSYPANTAENVAYTYDQVSTGFAFGIGRLTSVADAAGSLTRAYDERGNLAREKRANGNTTLSTGYTYDGASRIASMTYPDGTLVTNKHDAAGYLSSVTVRLPSATSTTTLATLSHLPFGPLSAVSYGNGISETWTYDTSYRATNIADMLSGKNVQKLTYGYDVANNVSSITDAVNAADSQTFGYDVINRLTSAVSGTGGYGSYGWTYDKVGNRLTQKAGSTSLSYSYTSGTNRLAKIGAVSVSTNADGNITSIPPANISALATFAYNKANRLASVTGSPLAATFIYDWAGQRLSKTDAGSTPTLFSYIQGGTLIEENDNGTLTDYVYADGRPIADLQPSTRTAANQVNFILSDRSGTPQLAFNSAGATAWKAVYQPFGTTGLVTASITQNLRLPGQYADVETGFNYNFNRYYMANSGRYSESDPIGLTGGINTYSYARENPEEFSDRLGLCPPNDVATVSDNPVVDNSQYADNEQSMASAFFRDGAQTVPPLPSPEDIAVFQGVASNSDLFAYFPSQQETAEYLNNVSTNLNRIASVAAPLNIFVAEALELGSGITGAISKGLNPLQEPSATLPVGERLPRLGPWGMAPMR